MSAAPLDSSGGLASRLRTQAAHCAKLGSPLYGGLLECAAEDVASGGPVADLLRGHEDDPVDSVLPLRFMGAVHRRVLEGCLPELEQHYSHAAAAAEAWPAFRQVVIDDAAALRPLLDRPVQTNEVGRSVGLLPGFLMVAAATGLPLRLLEVGASAGLNLRWDRYRYESDGFRWGEPLSPVRLGFDLVGSPPKPSEPEVVDRRGCDRRPLDPLSEEGRLTLLSFVWADQAQRLLRLQAALDVAREMPATVKQAGAAEWVAERLTEPREGVATVVFHSIVMQYLAKGEREDFERTAGRWPERFRALAVGLVEDGARRRAGGGPLDPLARWRGANRRQGRLPRRRRRPPSVVTAEAFGPLPHFFAGLASCGDRLLARRR